MNDGGKSGVDDGVFESDEEDEVGEGGEDDLEFVVGFEFYVGFCFFVILSDRFFVVGRFVLFIKGIFVNFVSIFWGFGWFYCVCESFFDK